MPSMSYCRYENGGKDLIDIVDSIHNWDYEELSSYEYEGLKMVLEMAHEIIQLEDKIEVILEHTDDNR